MNQIKKRILEDELLIYDILETEAKTVRKKDKLAVVDSFKNFFKEDLEIGIGFQRAYGAILAGDYFDLIKLPNKSFLFIFADISGHGLPAYTTLIKLKSSITIAINKLKKDYKSDQNINFSNLIKEISTYFADIMDSSNSNDFACVNFTFIEKKNSHFNLEFYNRSMLFPLVFHKIDDLNVNFIDLNENDQWENKKGFFLGGHLRKLQKNNYLNSPACSFQLKRGDSILFYSDGIIESYSSKEKDEFGQENIEKVMKKYINRSPQIMVDKLFNEVYKFIGSHKKQKDDMTAVLMKFHD